MSIIIDTVCSKIMVETFDNVSSVTLNGLPPTISVVTGYTKSPELVILPITSSEATVLENLSVEQVTQTDFDNGTF
ncbi:MAG: hypothetical protein P4L79_09805 [Legionella sp.]|uniref:hypothetical protein n=1 Tax=Legionella sp. TaxID=459 RepID=UPI00283F8808|nr:hypothetical protein [Legionella sp.]